MNDDLYERIGILVLRARQVDDRLEVLAEILILGVLRHTHDLENRFGLVRRSLASNSKSHRVSAFSKSPRELLIDDSDLGGVWSVLLAKIPSRQKRCAERFEIAVANPIEIWVKSRLAIFAFGPYPVIYARAAQRNDANLRCGLHARDVAKPIDDLLLDRQAACNRNAKLGQIKLSNQDIVLKKAGVNREHVCQRSRKKHCASDENQRQCNLSDHQPPAQSIALVRGARSGRAAFHRLAWRQPGAPQGGDHSKKQH